MRRLLLIPALFLSLAVAGCGTTGTNLSNLLSVVTTPVANPVTAVNLYQLKNGYAAALQLAADWRTYCYSKPYAQLLLDPVAKPICQNRRATVRTIQSVKATASAAVVDATNFVTANPTLDASTVINYAFKAITNFQNAVPAQ